MIRLCLIALLSVSPALVRAQPEAPAGEAEPGEGGGAPADEDDPMGIAAVAATLVQMTALRWEGPRTPEPRPDARPVADRRLDSTWLPLAVHAESEHVPLERQQAALEALEDAALMLSREGWPLPLVDLVDGGRGDSQGFDLYLAPTDELASGRTDGDVVWSFLDQHMTHAVVDPGVDRLRACVTQALGEAIGYHLDPAEAAPWRKALGTYLAWRVTGEWGCADAVQRQQNEPYRGWIPAQWRPGERAPLDGGGGALLFAMISQRHDGGTGAFIRDMWDLVRQRTWEQTHEPGLRGSPDFWEGFEAIFEHSGTKLVSYVDELAVARYGLGDPARERVWGLPGLHPSMGPEDAVPVLFETSLAELPHHTGASPMLDPYGSSYALVDVRGAPPRSRLRVWLRGEYGVEWQLTASRLDAEGRERGRLSAPPRRGDRRAYLPMELDAESHHVLVTVTNLGHRRPDADDPDVDGRAFRLIFELVEEGREPERD